MHEEELFEDSEETVLNEEYKIWKKHVPFLYDTVVTHVLEWPSLTVEWFPLSDSQCSTEFAVHKLLLGTHTSPGEQNQLVLANTKLPLEHSQVNGKVYADNTSDAGGIGLLTRTENKIEPITLINHDGEVNKARIMPQKPSLIATKGPSSHVLIFDTVRHSNKSTIGPQMLLSGHTREGFGLAWSPSNEGYLASGSDDSLLCVWDIATTNSSPLQTFSGHSAGVNGVSWALDNEILGSAGDDKRVALWDLRQQAPTLVIDAHTHEVNSIDFCTTDNHLLATASSDRTVAVWDRRNTAVKVICLEYHRDPVYRVQWAPGSSSLLASCSSDRRVLLWDLARVGQPQTEEEALDGPPELLFVHGGHTARVSDFAWNPNDPFTIASVAEDNILQLWQVSSSVVSLN